MAEATTPAAMMPCPFCCSTIVEVWMSWHPRCEVQCENCGAQGPVASTEEKAILWWNEIARPANPKTVRSRWSSRCRAVQKEVARVAAEAKRAERNSPEAKQLRKDRQWAAEREAWLRAPVPGDADG
jgi:hypothetical protein